MCWCPISLYDQCLIHQATNLHMVGLPLDSGFYFRLDGVRQKLKKQTDTNHEDFWVITGIGIHAGLTWVKRTLEFRQFLRLN